MNAKIIQKEKAILLRQRGLSYSEILKQVPVAKSSLSLWLHSVGLSRHQKQRLTRKKLLAMKRGWDTIRSRRIALTQKIKNDAKANVPSLIKDPFWLLGTSLYWAEGAKEKAWRTGEKMAFSNMDLAMHQLFIRWATQYLNLSPERFKFEIYIHESGDFQRAKRFWGRHLDVSPKAFRVYFKKDKKNSVRRNNNKQYHGVLRIVVTQGTNLNRKIAGWIDGVIEYFSK